MKKYKTISEKLKKQINLKHKKIEDIIDYIERHYDSIILIKEGTLNSKEHGTLLNACFLINKKYLMDINVVFDFIRIYTKNKDTTELIFASDLTIMNNNMIGILASIRNKFNK